MLRLYYINVLWGEIMKQDRYISEHYEAIEIIKGVWQILDKPDKIKPAVDIYLIEGSNKSLLIDAGQSNADLRGFVRQLTDKPVELLITHGHGDHAAGVYQFDKVYLSHKDIDSLDIFFGMKLDKSAVIDLHGGEILDLGDCRIEVIAFPGHTLGSVILLDELRQLLFTSDALGSGTLWMQLPHSTSVEEYHEQLCRLEKRLEGLDKLRVFPGHDCGRSLNYGIEYISDIRILAGKILSGEIVGEETADQSELFGGLRASYGKMKEFIYKPYNIY